MALRRFGLADLAEFVAYRSSAQVARFQSWDAPYSQEEGERFIRQMMHRHPDTAGEWFQFAVVLRPAGRLIGDCAAMPHADDPRQCEIGFTIAPGYQGHGYATEATGLLVGYLFTGRGKHRITASCDARNTASAAVLERLGMRKPLTAVRPHRGRNDPGCARQHRQGRRIRGICHQQRPR